MKNAMFTARTWVIACTLACSMAEAETTHTIYLDDDLFSGMSNDADYTGGGAFTVAGTLEPDATPGRQARLAAMDRLLGIQSSSYRYELEIGVAAFTPADIRDSEPVWDDRPYAGLVYVSGSLQQIQDPYRSAVTSLAVGVLGSAFVPHAQRRVHRTMGSERPRGWQHQVSDGAEPTLRLMHERKWTSEVTDFRGSRMQWFYRAGGGVGFLTDLSAGIGARVGRFADATWNIHGSATGLSDRGVMGSSDDAGDRFFYGTLSARVPLYNALLQGQFRHSDVTVPSDRIRRLVPDLTLGFLIGLPKGRDMHYFVRGQLADVKLPQRSDTTVYAGVALSW
ncbi:lipid A deacylase LpxR family protein [Povalibacter sp.]|uniref:lipid A deacylase LpxR family protein n=1 Tax=Povalibacter sp. TaxID=1962978 RepID=UPI002F42D666